MAETSGLVQRMKWAPDAHAVLVYLGPAPTAVRLFAILFDTMDPAALAFGRAAAKLLDKARNAGLAVRLLHDPDAIVTGVDTWSSPIRLEALEVTQAIQNLFHSVTLIAQKSTVVRAYLSYRSDPPVTVRGSLRIRRSPAGAYVTVASQNEVVLDAAQAGQVVAQRNDIQRSLNFVLPPDQLAAGSLEVELAEVVDVATNAPLDAGPRSPVTVTFVAGAPLRLRLLGISYQQGTPAQTFIPSALDFGLACSWLQRAYPVHQVQSSQAVVPATPSPPFDCGQINAQVAAMRALDMSGGADHRTHYFGLVSDGGFFMRGCAAVPGAPDPSAIGSGPTGPASWGWDFDGSYGDWYTGHELGHTFGRQHPGFCGETKDDLAYPFPAGQLSDADDAYVGVDVGDVLYGLPLTALPGTDWHDVMTYCNREWLSSYTYEGIRGRLLAEDALGPDAGSGRPDERFPANAASMPVGATRGRLVSVVASVDLAQRSGRIDYVNPLDRGVATVPQPDGPVSLVVKDGDGKVLYRCPVGVKPLSDTEEGRPERGLVDAIVVAPAGAKTIELWIGEHLADRFAAAATVPRVRNVRTTAAPRGPAVLSWETDAKPEDRNTYSVQVSTDNGRTWQTMAVGVASTEVPIDYAQFGASASLLVRVIATNGFDRYETTTSLSEAQRTVR